uniref:Uncharacterized protein n=1 Tax=Tanacetum cinerariifolium TaxID=118510 RepID=A0A699JKC2_TANCI|nr:hypothetical protein [Tanacetum cinerariifolium]
MPSEYQQDYKKTRAYAPKIYDDPNISDTLKDIYRTLESRYVHEGRTINPSFYNELSDVSMAKFTAIGTKMPSEYQQDYKKTRAYAPKIYDDPNISDTLKDIYRTLESRYVHEGRTINPSFYNELSDVSMAKFTAIGFDCLLSLDEYIFPRFIFEFYKTLKLERDSNNHFSIQLIINIHHFNISIAQFTELTYLPNQGICIYSDA